MVARTLRSIPRTMFLLLALLASPTRADTFFHIQGWKSDGVTLAFDTRLQPPTSTIGTTLYDTRAFRVFVASPYWDVVVDPAWGRYPRAGLYAGVWGNSSGNASSLSVSGAAVSVGGPGALQIRQITYQPSNTIASLWMTFDVPCIGSAVRVTGELRVNADTTLYAIATADTVIAPGMPVSVAVSAVDARGLPIALSAGGLPLGSVFTDHGDGTGVLEWPAGSNVSGEWTVAFLATSADGRTATTWTTLHVAKPDLARWSTAPGDFISGGVSGSYRPPAEGLLTAQYYARSMHVSFAGSGQNFSVDWRPPFERPMTTGVYPIGLPADPFRPTITNVNLGNSSRGCTATSGMLHVRALKLDAAQNVTSLWATLHATCQNATAALDAEIRLNADTAVYVGSTSDVHTVPGRAVRIDVTGANTRGGPVHLSVRAAPAGATFTDLGNGTGTFEWPSGSPKPDSLPLTFLATDAAGDTANSVTVLHVNRQNVFRMESELGDPVYLGRRIVSVPLDMPFITRGNSLSVSVQCTQDWLVGLVQFTAQTLTPGVYAVGTNDGCLDAGATMTATIAGRGCGFGMKGWFHLRRVVVDANNVLRSLWVTFAGTCPGGTTPLRGEVRIDADTTLYVTAPAAYAVPTGTPASFELSATDVLGREIQWVARGLPPGASLVPLGDGRMRFDWPGSSTAVSRTLTFVARVASGDSAFAVTRLRADPPNRLDVASAPGDYVGAGMQGTFTPARGSLALYALSGDGLQFAFYASGELWWTIEAQGPAGRRLRPGRYLGAAHYGDQKPDQAGMTVMGLNRECHGLTGSFEIRRIEYAAGGLPISLWATFDQWCGGYPGGLSAEVRFATDTTTYLVAPADVFAVAGTRVAFAVRAHDAAGRPIALRAAGLPTGSTFVDHGDGTGDFAWPQGPAPGESLAVDFVATYNGGGPDSSTTWIHGGDVSGFQAAGAVSDTTWRPFDLRLGLTDGSYAAHYDTSDSTIHATIVGGGHQVELMLRPAPGTVLEALDYPTALVASPWRYLGIPEFSATVDGAACPEPGLARFRIRQLAVDADGSVPAMWLTFRQDCYAVQVDEGELRLGSTGVVPTAVSLVDAFVAERAAHLRWQVSGDWMGVLVIQRCDESRAWSDLARVSPDGEGRVTFVDDTPVPGARHGYRLTRRTEGSEQSAGEVWLAFPQALAWALEPIRPNPGSGPVTVAFTLASQGPARLEVVDVAGRVRFAQDLHHLPAGSHTLEIGRDMPLVPGWYFVRLRAGGRVFGRRAVILR